MPTNAELIAEKTALLAEYQKAELAVLKNQSYTIKDRTLTRANMSHIVKEKRRLQNEIAKLQGGGMTTRLGFPRDY